jgi:hypothetical protein
VNISAESNIRLKENNIRLKGALIAALNNNNPIPDTGDAEP